MMGKVTMQKYVDPGSPIVKTTINGIEIPNTLIDLGAAINIMSRQTMEQLKLPNLLFTPTLLQLADRSIIKVDGVLEDISVSLDSWEYPVDFIILTPKSNLGGHPLILGRPWLATVDAFISCRSGDMYISDGNSTKKFNLYPPAKAIAEVGDNEWVDDEDTIQPIFTISEISEDSQILNTLENFETSSEYDLTQFQLDYDIEYLSSRQISLYSMEEFGSSTIEIFPSKTLNINKNLEKSQQEELTKILQKHSTAFAWEYTDMKGIDPKTCIHHIYIEENSRPIRQPQRRMNPNLREIVKKELQKLLNVNFIYPILDSRRVYPLVIVPKKNGKWRVCTDYRELNKATLKDHFPLPFIDQVLDTLAGKKYFSFLDGFSGYNQIQVAPEDRDKTTFTCPWGTFAYRVLPFGLCNAPATFQRAVLGIFSDLIHDCVEVYMDEFTVYGDSFEEALANLEKVLIRCKETNLSLSHEKCFMMFIEDIANYLVTGKLPPHLFPSERRKIIQESSKYSWISNELFKTGADLVIRRCVREDEMPDILKACHDEPCGEHFVDKRTTYKILSLGYYWPSLFKDVKQYVKRCDNCQRVGKPTFSNEMPLQPQVLIEPFEKWALDFIRPINLPSKQKKYILVCTDYVTKWVEAKALFSATENSVITFLYEDIFIRFGVPREIVTDQGSQFTSNLMEKLMEEYKIKHKRSTPYHPQINGQVESTNKVLKSIITKTVYLHIRDWAERLPEALWAYRNTWRNTTGHSPYELVYGKEVLLLIEFQFKTFKMAVQLGMDLSEAQKHRMEQLNELDEIRQEAILRTDLVQYQRVKWHDKYIKEKKFQEGDWALGFRYIYC
eukprot:PITA_26709